MWKHLKHDRLGQQLILSVLPAENICSDALSRMLQLDPAVPLVLLSDTWPMSDPTCLSLHVCRSQSNYAPPTFTLSTVGPGRFNYAAAGQFIQGMCAGYLAPLICAACRVLPQSAFTGGYTCAHAHHSHGDGCSGEEPASGNANTPVSEVQVCSLAAS
jgi:hypothetical protein